MTVKEKAFTAIKEEQMIPPNTTVIVGLSGGADSVTLLHVLRELQPSLRLSALVAVHINHQLRGEESLRDQRFCEALCKEWKIPLEIRFFDVSALAKQEGKGIEEMARELRYNAFREIASSHEKAIIATAHTATDNAETVILHLCRGCGLHGLTGIPPKRGMICRPLLACTREEIEKYCHENALQYVSDSTNTDTRYARNRVRHEVIPVLKSINPQVEQAFSRVISQVRMTDAYVEKLAKEVLECAKTEKQGCWLKDPFLNVDTVIQSTALYLLCRTLNIGCEEQHIQEVITQLPDIGTVSLPADYICVIDSKTFTIKGKKPKRRNKVQQPITVETGKSYAFCDDVYTLTLLSKAEYEQKLNNSKFSFQNACSYDRISGSLILRHREAGDAFHPSGRGCGKTLKKLFNETKTERETRETVPILCDEKGIILVYGFGCDRRVEINGDTKQILMLQKTEE